MALSEMVMDAVRAPVVVGPKCPWMVQFAPAARLDPQEFANTNDEASVPVTAMLVIVIVEPLVLVIVTVCEALLVPTYWAPNERLVGDRDTAGGVVPVPLSETICGEPMALSVMVIAAVRAPVVVGPKCPWMVQFAPAARLDPQEFANTNDEASVPVTAMLVMVSVEPPVLVKVTFCDALPLPTLTVPKERLVAESDTAALDSVIRAALAAGMFRTNAPLLPVTAVVTAVPLIVPSAVPSYV